MEDSESAHIFGLSATGSRVHLINASNSYGEDTLEGERGDRGAEGRADGGNEEERAYTREGARRLGN